MLLSLAPLRAQQRGKATYYSRKANGVRMSDGTRYHSDSLVCAHRKYPFGSMLKVTNPANGKHVVVRVADRGPFAKGRIIDLSYSAAKALGILSQGVAMVEVELYRNPTKIPYRAEPESVDLPELDLEVTAPGEAFRHEQNPTKSGQQAAHKTQPKARADQSAKKN